MELRHLRYFVAVAEELNFSHAALRLNISQSPLSQQIAGLEQELGIRLLERTRRSVELTRAGEVFLKRARSILIDSQNLIVEARRVDRGFEGHVGIGFVSAVMLSMLNGHLKEFHRRAPGGEVALRQGRCDEQCAALINGTIDVAFVDITMSEMLPPVDTNVLDVLPAMKFQLMLCTAPDHPLSGKDCVSTNDLRGLPFITLTRNNYPTSCDVLFQICRSEGFLPFVSQQVESMPAVFALASVGYGVALVPVGPDRCFHHVDVCLIPLETAPEATIYMLSRRTDQTVLVEEMRQICRERTTAEITTRTDKDTKCTIKI